MNPKLSGRNHARLPRLLWILSSCLACVSDHEGEGNDATRIDNQPVWGDEITLEEELCIGELDGAPEYTLGHVSAMAVGSDGSIFVYDAAVNNVIRFDSSGAWVAVVGGEGEGPGEYRVVQGIRTLPGGRLATWDPRLNRITVYDTDGGYLDSYRVPFGLHDPRSFEIDTAGNFYVMSWNPQAATETEIPKFFIKVSSSGQILDTIPLPLENSVGPRFVVPTDEGWRYPFLQATKWALSPFGYLVTGRNTEYAFTLHLADGPPRRFGRAYTPVELTGEERGIWQRRVDAFYERKDRPDGPPAVTPSDPSQATDLPKTKPAYRDLWTDDDGRIWVERYVRAERRPVRQGWRTALLREPTTFDVIEPDGTFLGTVVLPPHTSIYVRRDDRIWCVRTGEFDEPYVVRYRIVPGG